MSAVAYTRVSGEAQLDGYGLEIQADGVARLAELEGLVIDETFTDGLSGTLDSSERPGLDALITYCQDHPGTTVLLPKLDRLARALAIQETVLAVLWQAGAIVLSCDPSETHYLRTGDDPEDPTRTLIRQVLGAVAQFDRAQIRIRLRNGRRKKIKSTGWAGGVEPYGWSDPAERQVVADVGRMRTDGTTWREVCAVLNARGDVKRNGNPWNETELCQIIRKVAACPVAS